jgi:ribosomal protein S18 acetylase RimI-like enzyme
MERTQIRRAEAGDVDEIGRLFDAYRQFYRRPPDIGLATRFVRERLERGESVILLATRDSMAVGFCQLYPTWCSVAAAPIFVLYDLYVDAAARRHGVGRALMLAAHDAAREARVVRVDLQTAHTNMPARALYESLGWERDVTFDTYHLAID